MFCCSEYIICVCVYFGCITVLHSHSLVKVSLDDTDPTKLYAVSPRKPDLVDMSQILGTSTQTSIEVRSFSYAAAFARETATNGVVEPYTANHVSCSIPDGFGVSIGNGECLL